MTKAFIFRAELLTTPNNIFWDDLVVAETALEAAVKAEKIVDGYDGGKEWPLGSVTSQLVEVSIISELATGSDSIGEELFNIDAG